MLGLFLCTPYVRQGGLGQALADHLPRRAAGWVLLASLLLCLLLGSANAILPMLGAFAAFIWLRRLMCKRLGGTTGDTAGAMLEILELTVLLGLAI